MKRGANRRLTVDTSFSFVGHTQLRSNTPTNNGRHRRNKKNYYILYATQSHTKCRQMWKKANNTAQRKIYTHGKIIIDAHTNTRAHESCFAFLSFSPFRSLHYYERGVCFLVFAAAAMYTHGISVCADSM